MVKTCQQGSFQAKIARIPQVFPAWVTSTYLRRQLRSPIITGVVEKYDLEAKLLFLRSDYFINPCD